MIVDKESYEPAAASPASQIYKLKAKGVDTVMLFTTPTFTVVSLAGITRRGWTPTIYVNSGANPSANMAKAKAAGAELKTVPPASYLKDPSDPRWANDAGIRLYKQIIGSCASCDANNDFNISGVAGAYTMVDVLKQAGSNMTRQNVMNIAATQLNETNPFALPGIVIRTTPTDHFPISQMQIETWSGTAWTLQGGLVDVRGAIKYRASGSNEPGQGLLVARLPAHLHASPAPRGQPRHRALAAVGARHAHVRRSLPVGFEGAQRAAPAGVDMCDRRDRA